MMTRQNLSIFWALSFLSLSAFLSVAQAKKYLIYSVAHDFPMGENTAIRPKNFYVNMGQELGLKQGSILNVYRNLDRSNPFSTEKAVAFKVKVGELEVLQAQEGNAIAVQKVATKDQNLLEEPGQQVIADATAESLFIGDLVEVKAD